MLVLWVPAAMPFSEYRAEGRRSYMGMTWGRSGLLSAILLRIKRAKGRHI